MQHETLELIDRLRRRLRENDLPSSVAGGVSEAAVGAAESALELTFPPSYRTFLRKVGALSLPARVSTIHEFVGLGALTEGEKDVVTRTQHARLENRLRPSLVIVALGAQPGEWFVVDANHADDDGQCPVYLFDARDNQLDQQFYGDFAEMLHETLSFVLENLEESGDRAADESSRLPSSF